MDIVSYAIFSCGRQRGRPASHPHFERRRRRTRGTRGARDRVSRGVAHGVRPSDSTGGSRSSSRQRRRADSAPLAAELRGTRCCSTRRVRGEARLAERGIAYEQYLYTEGLFERSWPAYRESLERLWQPTSTAACRLPRAQAVVAAHKLPYRGDALVAASRTFVFYSDVVTNLHDFLVWNARSQEPVEPKPDCLAGLPAQQRIAFEHARDYYAKTFANGAGELVLLSMRWRLANFGEFALADPAQISATVAELAPATPSYEACWWRSTTRATGAGSRICCRCSTRTRTRCACGSLSSTARQLARSLPVTSSVRGHRRRQLRCQPASDAYFERQTLEPGLLRLEVLVARSLPHALRAANSRAPLWEALQQASSVGGQADPRRLLAPVAVLYTGRRCKRGSPSESCEITARTRTATLFELPRPRIARRSSLFGYRTSTAAADGRSGESALRSAAAERTARVGRRAGGLASRVIRQRHARAVSVANCDRPASLEPSRVDDLGDAREAYAQRGSGRRENGPREAWHGPRLTN